jgi:hypothetical protein
VEEENKRALAIVKDLKSCVDTLEEAIEEKENYAVIIRLIIVDLFKIDNSLKKELTELAELFLASRF